MYPFDALWPSDVCKHISSIDELFQFIRVHVAELLTLIYHVVLRVPSVVKHDLFAFPLTSVLLFQLPSLHVSRLGLVFQRAIGS